MVTAVVLSPEHRRRNQHHIVHQLAAGTGRFDGIVAVYLLGDLADPGARLRAFAALLHPGAPLAVHAARR